MIGYKNGYIRCTTLTCQVFSSNFLPFPEQSSPTVTPKHFVSTEVLSSLVGALEHCQEHVLVLR